MTYSFFHTICQKKKFEEEMTSSATIGDTYMCGSNAACRVGDLCSNGSCITEGMYITSMRPSMTQPLANQQNAMQQMAIPPALPSTHKDVCLSGPNQGTILTYLQGMMPEFNITNNCTSQHTKHIACSRDAMGPGFMFNVKPSDVPDYTSNSSCYLIEN